MEADIKNVFWDNMMRNEDINKKVAELYQATNENVVNQFNTLTQKKISTVDDIIAKYPEVGNIKLTIAIKRSINLRTNHSAYFLLSKS